MFGMRLRTRTDQKHVTNGMAAVWMLPLSLPPQRPHNQMRRGERIVNIIVALEAQYGESATDKHQKTRATVSVRRRSCGVCTISISRFCGK